jgi:hypothetical protein
MLERLDHITAELHALRAAIAALIWLHPDDAAMLRELKRQNEVTMAQLLGASTPDEYLALVERKMKTFEYLAGEPMPEPPGAPDSSKR